MVVMDCNGKSTKIEPFFETESHFIRERFCDKRDLQGKLNDLKNRGK